MTTGEEKSGFAIFWEKARAFFGKAKEKAAPVAEKAWEKTKEVAGEVKEKVAEKLEERKGQGEAPSAPAAPEAPKPEA